MPPIDFSQITALAIEDDTGGIALMGMILRRLGINATIDTSGKHAVELALSMKPRPDIIFMDLSLPRQSGFELIQKFRRQPLLNHARIIAVSAMDAESAIPKCQEAGFDGFIAKPVRVKTFIEHIRAIMQGEPVWDVPLYGNLDE